MKIGIKSFGLYVPYHRIERKTVGQFYQSGGGKGEKAVAYYDEDSITMAVAAAENCLSGTDTASLGACYFASTSSPYSEKQAASLVASALDVKENLRASDFAGSLRAGGNALLSALDFAAQGGDALVAVADCPTSLAASANELMYGDGAAAFLVGSEDLIAELIGSYSISHDFADTWRLADEGIPRTFDAKYAMEYGYIPFVTKSIKGVLNKYNLTAEQITKVVLDATNERKIAAIAETVGFAPEQFQAPLLAEFGYAASAYAPMLLTSALEQSQAGDLILYVSYGEGSDALLFCSTAEGKPGKGRGLAHYATYKNNTLRYDKYLRWKNMLELDPPRRPTPRRVSLVDYYRNSKKNLGGYGSICTDCGTPIFPAGRVCPKCHAIDHMEPYSFRGRVAKVATFTFDALTFSPDPPNLDAVVDFEGGGRMFAALVDVDPKSVAIGMQVELSFRVVRDAEGVRVYAWKVVPCHSVVD